MKKYFLLPLILLAGCASSTDEIATAYVSPLQYQDFSCKQLSSEIARVSRRAQEVASNVNKNAEGDSTAMAVGLILFWPALFFIDGDTPQAQEYARLKGEFDALEQAGIQKECGLTIENDPFLEIEKARQQKATAHKSIEPND